MSDQITIRLANLGDTSSNELTLAQGSSWDGNYKTAKENGDKQYDGRPCKRCGGTRRFTCSTTCVTCMAMWYRARRAKLKAENHEEYKARKRAEYHKYKAAMADNIKQWSKTAREKRPEYSSEYKKANLHKGREQASRRIAMKKQAVPPWETASMRECIKDMYHLAAIMTNDKQKYEVDHIVPLNGKTVNGLHVPWNLWVVTAEDNNRRPRNWQPCNLNNLEALAKNGLNDLPQILAYTG